VSRFCAAHGISRAQFYRIQGEATGDNPTVAVAAKTTAPKHQAAQVDPAVEAVALEIRAQLIKDGWDGGPVTVATMMLRRGLTPPSRATLARIFTRNGMVEAQPQKKPRAAYRRFTYPDPNGCWQLDGMYFELDSGITRCILQVEDDNARIVLESLIAVSENSAAAIEVVSRAVIRHGAPRYFLTDNGLAFNQSRRGSEAGLEKYLRSQGATPITGRPGKPTTQGKNERLHQTLRRFLDANRPINTVKRLQALVDQFDDYYNNTRPHQSLGGLTPAQAYNAKPKAQPADKPLPPPLLPPVRRRQAGETVAENDPGAHWADRIVRDDFRINICHTRIYVGPHLLGQTLHIMFDDAFITVFDQNGTFIGRTPRPNDPTRNTSVSMKPLRKPTEFPDELSHK